MRSYKYYAQYVDADLLVASLKIALLSICIAILFPNTRNDSTDPPHWVHYYFADVRTRESVVGALRDVTPRAASHVTDTRSATNLRQGRVGL